MPELPEVETVCRGLAPILEGRRFQRVEAHRAGLRRPFPENLSERLEGRRVERVWRRAKYFLWDLDDGMSVLGHLGMSGRISVAAADDVRRGRHDHLCFHLEEGVRIVFTDPRRFGLVLLLRTAELDRHPLLIGLGPEPLSPEFTDSALLLGLKGRKSPVKNCLLDQKLVSGLGNIYVAEALFRSGLSPARPGGSIGPAEAQRLTAAIKAVLAEAIDAGGTSLRDYRQADGALGYFRLRLAVYGREGQACPGCRCDLAQTGGIRRMTQGGRSTFFCAARQR